MDAVAPARIEQGDFSADTMPDVPEAAIPANGLAAGGLRYQEYLDV